MSLHWRAALAPLLGLLWPLSAAAQGFTRETVAWRTDGVALEGTLHLPAGRGPHPAAVFIHGSGTLTRSAPIYREHAERLARSGLAMLVYDKRGTGESGGDWRGANFTDLANDALGAVRRLRQDPRIDSRRIGLFGASQGGWIALIAAAADPGIAFIVTLSGPTITPAEQGHFIVEANLRGKYTEADIREAVALDRRIVDVYRTNTGWEAAQAALESARTKPWFSDAGIGLQSRDASNWKWYRDLPFDFDPMPLLRSLAVPLFAAHGAHDRLVPADRSAQTIEALAATGKDFTTFVFPDAAHVLHVVPEGPARSWRAPPTWWTMLRDWLSRRSILP